MAEAIEKIYKLVYIFKDVKVINVNWTKEAALILKEEMKRDGLSELID